MIAIILFKIKVIDNKAKIHIYFYGLIQNTQRRGSVFGLNYSEPFSSDTAVL